MRYGPGGGGNPPSSSSSSSSAPVHPPPPWSESAHHGPSRQGNDGTAATAARHGYGNGNGHHIAQAVNTNTNTNNNRYSQALPPPSSAAAMGGSAIPPYSPHASQHYQPQPQYQQQQARSGGGGGGPGPSSSLSSSAGTSSRQRIVAPPPADLSPYGAPPEIPFDHDELGGGGAAGIGHQQQHQSAPTAAITTAATRAVLPADLPWSIHLPDQTSALIGFEQSYLSLLGDLQAFLAAKADLEREHGQKLAALVKKTQDRLGCSSSSGPDRRARALVVGDDPAREWDDSLVARHTLLSALRQHLHVTTQSAERHVKLADDTNDQVLEGLKRAESKKGEIVKRVKGYVQEAVDVRDQRESKREKCKSRYHEACQEVEAARAKAEKQHQGAVMNGGGISSLEAAALTEMRIAKNDYILSIRASNDAKRCLYRDALPRWSGELQDVHASTVTRAVELLAHSASLDAAAKLHLARLARQVYDGYQTVQIGQDQDLFAQWNARKGWKAPADAVWEPCPGYYADERLECQGEGEKIHLQNRLMAASKVAQDAGRSRETQTKEISNAKGTMYAYEKNRGLGDPDDFRDTMLATLNDLTLLEIRNEVSMSETDVLTLALDGDLGPQRPHDFRSTTFTIPADCDHCGAHIWGMGKQGYTCTRCKANAHVKCALRLPANCLAGQAATSAADKRKSLAFGRRQSTAKVPPAATSNNANTGPLDKTSKRRSFMAGMGGGRRRSEQAQASRQDAAAAAAIVSDSASASTSSVSVVTPAVTSIPAPHRQASPPTAPPIATAEPPRKQWLAARALYDYVASDVDELSVQRGQELLLVSDATTQPGWVLVRQTRDSNGRLLPLTQTGGYLEGLVPADYIEKDPNTAATPIATPCRHPGQAVRALYAYHPDSTATDEMELVAGKTYYLTDVGWTWGQAEGTSAVDERGRSEWWEIAAEDGRVGVAPGNYLQVV